MRSSRLLLGTLLVAGIAGFSLLMMPKSGNAYGACFGDAAETGWIEVSRSECTAASECGTTQGSQTVVQKKYCERIVPECSPGTFLWFNACYYYNWTFAGWPTNRVERVGESTTPPQTSEETCAVSLVQCAEPTPSPTPTDDPEDPRQAQPEEPQQDNGYSGYRSSLANDRLQCGNSSFDAVMDLKYEGYPAKDVKVKFTFNDQVKEISTNQDGRAKIDFDMAEGPVYAKAEHFPEQSMYINPPKDCPIEQVTSMAATGAQSNYAVLALATMGLSLAAAAAYAYKKAR